MNAETISTALDAFTDRPSEADDRTPAQRKADGLARLCRVAMGADKKTAVMASPSAVVVIDWATFLAHLNREAFVRFGQMDGSFIGSLPPSEIETHSMQAVGARADEPTWRRDVRSHQDGVKPIM